MKSAIIYKGTCRFVFVLSIQKVETKNLIVRLISEITCVIRNDSRKIGDKNAFLLFIFFVLFCFYCFSVSPMCVGIWVWSWAGLGWDARGEGKVGGERQGLSSCA